MFRKIGNIRNLGNVHIRGPHIVMSRTDAQNGLDLHFKLSNAHQNSLQFAVQPVLLSYFDASVYSFVIVTNWHFYSITKRNFLAFLCTSRDN